MFGRIKCAWRGHDTKEIIYKSGHTVKFICGSCKRVMVYNEHTEALIPWDEKIARTYERIKKLDGEE